jgi:hypothetical protein
MHYTILVFTCPYIFFGTPGAILRGVVKSSQFSMRPIQEDKLTIMNKKVSDIQ